MAKFKEGDIVLIDENTGKDADNWRAKLIEEFANGEHFIVRDVDEKSEYKGQEFTRHNSCFKTIS